MQTIRALLVFLFLSATAAYASDGFVLHYDSPAKEKSAVNRGKGKKPSKFGFMQTALPLGNAVCIKPNLLGFFPLPRFLSLIHI